MPEPKFPMHPTKNGEPLTMKHDRIRAGSRKRTHAENDNPNVTELHQPDDPGEGNKPQAGPKHEAPDTAARLSESVERAAWWHDARDALTLGLSVGAVIVLLAAMVWAYALVAG